MLKGLPNVKPQARAGTQAAVEARSVPTRRTEIVVVSSDDGLLIELGPVLGERFRVHAVDRLEAIAGIPATSRWLGLIDTASVPDAREAVTQLRRLYAGAPLIVVASTPGEWTSSVPQDGVVAVIARDHIAGPALIDALTVAESRLRAGIPEPDASPTPSLGDASGRGRSRLVLAIPLGLLVLMLIAGIAWWLTRKPTTQQPVLEMTNTLVPSAAVPEKVEPDVATGTPQSVLELLSAARAAFRDQRLLLPRPDGDQRGDSALDLYDQVLARDPTNEEALDGVRRLFAIGSARVQNDLASGKLDDATRLVAMFREGGVDPESLRQIDAAIVAARPKWLGNHVQESIAAGDLANAEQLISQMAASGADRASIVELRRAVEAKKLDQQLVVMSGEVKSAIDAGSLLDPAGDNARTRLQAMRAISRNHPATLTAQRELQAALLLHALDAIHKDQFDPAQRYIAAAGDIGVSTELTDAKRQLQSEMDLVAQRTAAAAAAEISATQAAASANASAPAIDAPVFIRAKPTSPLNVIYPDAALRQNAEGSVTVEFTSSPNGTASNATVVEATPAGVFDHVATKAVLSGRYDVSALPNHKPARARIRLTFKAH